jgi:hypothetical protein
MAICYLLKLQKDGALMLLPIQLIGLVYKTHAPNN